LSKFHLSLFLSFLLFAFPFVLYAQGSDSLKQRSLENYVQFHEESPRGKIFLHFDRSNYLQGDTIWFKAYLWYGYDQILDTISGILHVDLLNAEGKIIKKKKLLIKNGTSFGEFSLDTTIIPGLYTIRAYTLLMQNLNTGEPFYQTVTITPTRENFQFECTPIVINQIRIDSLKIKLRFFEIDQKGDLNKIFNHRINYTLKIGDFVLSDSILAENTKEQILEFSLQGINKHDSIADLGFSIKDRRLTFEKTFHIPLQENIDLQFFPEGGKMVDALENKVAFKAIGIDGLGRDVSGEIRTADEQVVTNFKSTHKGMGFFILKPETQKKYFAHFWYNNQKYIVPLPDASEEGTVVSVYYLEQKDPFLTIKQNLSKTLTNKYLVGSSYGKIWFSAMVKTFRDSCRLRIPLEFLPQGICRLTILNSFFEPECERMIYIDKNQRFKIEAVPDSSSYKTRSKVSLLIKATNLYGIPVQTDLSLAVLDKEQIIKNSEVHGISAHKLIESELKGHIEDADFYFKNDSTNKIALDLLMLTQGYRKFSIKNKNSKELQYETEKYFNISGKLKFDGSKTHEGKFNYRDISLVLICGSKNSYLGQSKPDSLGKFKFQIPLMYGKSHAMLQATTPKKKPFNGDIILENPVTQPQLSTIPSFSYTSPSIEYIKGIQAVKKTEISKIPLYGSMSRSLDEVVVTAKANAKYWWHNYDKDAIKIANLDSLDPGGNRYMNINDLLVEEFGAIRYNRNGLQTVLLPIIRSVGRGGSYWFPIYVVDGEKFWNGEGFDFTPLQTLSSFHVDAIKRILVVPPGKGIAMYYAYEPIIGFPQFMMQSLVIIETYSKNIYRGDPQGIKTFILDGLDAPRVFYSPRYEGFLKNIPVYDGRATIFWAPSILTDENGQAKIEFFTSDRQTSLEVIANGIEVGNGYSGEVNTQISMNIKK
jgi:hypothetical protein